jgi:hypothetical protein
MNDETKRKLSQAEQIKNTLNSDGWKIIKDKLMTRMSELSNILMIEETDPVKIMHLVAANQQAIKMVISWFQDLEASISLAEDFKRTLKDDMNKMVITSQEDNIGE